MICSLHQILSELSHQEQKDRWGMWHVWEGIGEVRTRFRWRSLSEIPL